MYRYSTRLCSTWSGKFWENYKRPPFIYFLYPSAPMNLCKKSSKTKSSHSDGLHRQFIGFPLFPQKIFLFFIHHFFWFPPFEILEHWQNFEVCYSQVANRRGGCLLIFPTPPELINFPDKNFWSGSFYYWLAIFSILCKRKRLFDSYLKHLYLTLFIYKPYQR